MSAPGSHCIHCHPDCRGDMPETLGGRLHRSPDDHAYWDSGSCGACTAAERIANRIDAEANRLKAACTPDGCRCDAAEALLDLAAGIRGGAR